LEELQVVLFGVLDGIEASGNYHDGNTGFLQLECQRNTVFSRQQNIEDDAIDTIVDLQNVAHRGAVGYGGHAIVAILEHFDHDVADVVIVVDDENVFGLAQFRPLSWTYVAAMVTIRGSMSIRKRT
jgi:hypothetical protein